MDAGLQALIKRGKTCIRTGNLNPKECCTVTVRARAQRPTIPIQGKLQQKRNISDVSKYGHYGPVHSFDECDPENVPCVNLFSGSSSEIQHWRFRTYEQCHPHKFSQSGTAPGSRISIFH